MKTSRLLAYGIGGVIAGLLLENSGLRLRQQAGQKVRSLKKKAAGNKLPTALKPR